MRKKQIEQIAVKLRKGKGGSRYTGTAQDEAGYLIINVFDGRRLVGRYCTDKKTGEYACYANGIWSGKKLMNLLGCSPIYQSISQAEEEFCWDSMEDQVTAEIALGMRAKANVIREIHEKERDWQQNIALNTKQNKYRRIDAMMATIPDIPENVKEWAKQKVFRERYLFWDREEKTYTCSECLETMPEKKLHRAAGRRLKHNEECSCPHCGRKVIVKKRQQEIWKKDRVILMQPWNGEQNVVRHFIAESHQDRKEHRIYLDEQVRLLVMKKTHGKAYEIYYDQDGGGYEWWTGLERPEWSTQNPYNKRMRKGYLYPEGIRETLEGTAYENVVRAFELMAGACMKADYNSVMAVAENHYGIGNTLEYLHKGRFYRLLEETADNCDTWNGNYYGILHLSGKNIQEVFGILDMQKIHRIRQQDGGEEMIRWMQYADASGKKIPQETLDWLIENEVTIKDINDIGNRFRFIVERMSLERIKNYIISQMGTYGTAKRVLEQWGDYLYMMEANGKLTEDELICRPKDLKRRHDEAVEDRQKLQIVKAMMEDPEAREQEAQEMAEKFPEASGILEKIKEKYEYTSGEFCMVMPDRLADIVAEGYALHHCGGSSDRYFNRIANRETYIGFCRRAAEPNIPYYTIEFEPNGTIRQSRTYYDEETGIEAIRGFLKEWQQEIKKRLTKEDRDLQAKSAELREKNLEELRQKRNTFVLKKLEEDFMEAG